MRFANLLPLAAIALEALVGVPAVYADAAAGKTTQQYLEEAKAHLAAGRHNAALDAFDAAICTCLQCVAF